MSIDLANNPAHLRVLRDQLGLGAPQRELERVHGGFHHRVWRLDTDCGSYAIKQLSVDTDLGDPTVVEHYNVSEAIAEAFAGRGISAVFALKYRGDYLHHIEDSAYLVHPWRDAKALATGEISEPHALQVATILARIHRADIAFSGLAEPTRDAYSQANVVDLVTMSEAIYPRLGDALKRELPTLLGIIDAQHDASELLSRHQVISHGDLDQKNVLWDSAGLPAVIDWESARKLNPTYEALNQALNWSGITSRFDERLFANFRAAYRRAGGVIDRKLVNASYDCILGDWVAWLMYNVGHTFDLDESERLARGGEQIGLALATVQRLMDQIPNLLSVRSRKVRAER